MATAQTIIDRALRLIGAIESGVSPTPAESADGLISLNSMLESWQLDKSIVYAFQETNFTLVPNAPFVTLGASGNISQRPNRIEAVVVRASNTDYTVSMLTADEWYSIASKSTGSDIPEFAYYEPSFPQGKLYLWPVPTAANSLRVVMWTPLTAFASLSTTVILPPGYERALSYNLAIEVSPEYGTEPSMQVLKVAQDSLAALKRNNNRTMIAGTDLPYVVGDGLKSNIVADTP